MNLNLLNLEFQFSVSIPWHTSLENKSYFCERWFKNIPPCIEVEQKKINSRGNFSFHRWKWEKDAKICGKQFSDVKHKKIYNSLVQRVFLPLI